MTQATAGPELVCSLDELPVVGAALAEIGWATTKALRKATSLSGRAALCPCPSAKR